MYVRLVGNISVMWVWVALNRDFYILKLHWEKKRKKKRVRFRSCLDANYVSHRGSESVWSAVEDFPL